MSEDTYTPSFAPIDPTTGSTPSQEEAPKSGYENDIDAEVYHLTHAYQQGLTDKKDYTPEGYQIDSELSGRDRVVYTKDGKATVVFRATQPSNPHDIIADMAIATGTESWSGRFKHADDVTKAAMAKYGAENIHLAGYSLGGSQAIYLSNKYKLPATVFNPGFSQADVFSSSTKDYSRVNAYVTPGDVISNSIFSSGGKMNVKSVVDWKDTARTAGDLASGGFYRKTRIPLTGGQAVFEGLTRVAEVAEPEFIPIIEGGKKVVAGMGIAKEAYKTGTGFHELSNFKDHFGTPDLVERSKSVTPVTPVKPPTPPSPRPSPTPTPKPKESDYYPPGSGPNFGTSYLGVPYVPVRSKPKEKKKKKKHAEEPQLYWT